MRKLVRIIDSISGYAGGFAKWLAYLLVLVVVYDVLMRYVFNAPPMWAYDSAVMLGGTIYVLAWAYTHRYRGHVRVDVIYTHLSPRTKAIIDAAGTFFLLFPLLGILVHESFVWQWRAWKIGERFMETYFYPPAAPFRTMVLLGFCLLSLQAVAQFIRDLYFCLKNKPYD
ncbi:MAG TPA: TRAP transporter small permease subunit [Dehalococcoidia bacterium]|jgi:TRAP-type mannitol/chloroaromatic compound transport system permease small subunit|nr:TRAP transporter small permease subunit [Dehalococcoidia bacterium]